MEITRLKGEDLTDSDLNEINAATFREWKMEPKRKDEFLDTEFFFLKDGRKILAMGGLKKVEPVFLSGEKFSILGFVEVIANIKGKGYGKTVVTAMREDAVSKNLSAMGFTKPKNIGFYEKCGVNIEKNSSQRFVYTTRNGKKITDDEGQVIFYIDGKDKFMEKVLGNPNVDVDIPTDGLW